MKTRADLYSREAAELLRIVSIYPGVTLSQLCGFYPGKEDLVQTLLPQLKRQGRILQEPDDRYYPQGFPASAIDPELGKAVWVLLDFIDRAEYHSVSDFPVKIIFFAGGELYEIISVPSGQEVLISHILQSGRQENYGKRILLVEHPGQIPALEIPGASGYCTVNPDGRVNYFKKQ